MNPEPIENHRGMQDFFDPVLTHLILLIKKLQPVEVTFHNLKIKREGCGEGFVHYCRRLKGSNGVPPGRRDT